MGVGSLIAGALYLGWDWYLDRTKNSPQTPAWSKKEEYNRLPIACLGGPLFVR